MHTNQLISTFRFVEGIYSVCHHAASAEPLPHALADDFRGNLMEEPFMDEPDHLPAISFYDKSQQSKL